MPELILIVLLPLAIGATIFLIRTLIKNKKLVASLDNQRKDHQEFAKRFSAVTDLEAETESARQKLQSDKAALTSFLNSDRDRRDKLESEYKAARMKYTELKEQISLLEESLSDISYGFYEPHFTFDTSEDYKTAIKECRNRQRALIRNKTAAISPGNWTINGSRSEGAKMERQYTKVMLRSFNGECDAAVSKVKWNNVARMIQRVEKAYGDINKLGNVMKISISHDYMAEKLDEIRLTHEYQDKKHQEREDLREQRAQLREQERAEREIKKAEEDAEREERRHRQALEKARSEADAATGEQLKRLTEQIASLEKKVGEAHTRKERAMARAQLTKSGFVYVLSNQGSFGDGVLKIGMTRRMEPMDRVKELGDASVPFPFDVHVIMFSENAPALERALHEHFEDRRVNLVNRRKEYFRDVSLDEVERIVRARGVTAQFTSIPEAREYRETQTAIRDRSEVTTEDEPTVAEVLFAK